ncbi:hypothetical protein Tco_1359795 [Tanacetum coccineum]
MTGNIAIFQTSKTCDGVMLLLGGGGLWRGIYWQRDQGYDFEGNGQRGCLILILNPINEYVPGFAGGLFLMTLKVYKEFLRSSTSSSTIRSRKSRYVLMHNLEMLHYYEASTRSVADAHYKIKMGYMMETGQKFNTRSNAEKGTPTVSNCKKEWAFLLRFIKVIGTSTSLDESWLYRSMIGSLDVPLQHSGQDTCVCMCMLPRSALQHESSL